MYGLIHHVRQIGLCNQEFAVFLAPSSNLPNTAAYPQTSKHFAQAYQKVVADEKSLVYSIALKISLSCLHVKMFFPQKWHYRKIIATDNMDMDEKEECRIEPSTKPSSNRRALFIFVVLFSVAVIISGVPLYDALSRKSRRPGMGPCGNSSAEALALGCTFDQLMWSWYPKYCPHYANDEFMNAEPAWQFYIDPHNKTVASGDAWIAALDNKQQIWGEKGEHMTHCVYMFLNLGQIIRDRGRYTPRQVEYTHLEHCADMLLAFLKTDNDWHRIQTKAPLVRYDQDC